MKLVDMKKPKPKNTLRKSTKAMEVVPSYDEPAYPWGLEVSLDQDSIKKLDIDVENINAGDEVYFLAKAQITRVSMNANIDSQTGKKNENGDIGLQIQKMHWGKPGKGF